MPEALLLDAWTSREFDRGLPAVCAALGVAVPTISGKFALLIDDTGLHLITGSDEPDTTLSIPWARVGKATSAEVRIDRTDIPGGIAEGVLGLLGLHVTINERHLSELRVPIAPEGEPVLRIRVREGFPVLPRELDRRRPRIRWGGRTATDQSAPAHTARQHRRRIV